MKKGLCAAAAALALAACDMRPEHAEWQSQCVSSHTDVFYMVVSVPSGPNGQTMTTLQPQYTETCDAYAPVCVAGKDGSTECGPLK